MVQMMYFFGAIWDKFAVYLKIYGGTASSKGAKWDKSIEQH